MKKVSDKLEELFKNDREDFEKKWDDIKVFIEYGMISEDKFYERAQKFALLKNVDGKYFTLDEYKEKIEKGQADKNKKIVALYATNKDEQYAYIKSASERSYDVLLLDGVLDNHFINTLEQKLDNMQFKRVDSETIDKLIETEDSQPSKLSEEDEKLIKPVFEKLVDTSKYTIVFESLSESDMPVLITQPEFMRRMKDMSQLGGGMPFMGGMGDTYNLVINSNHPLVDKLLKEEDEEKKEHTGKQLVDLALLSQNLLKGEALSDFINRSVDIIK